MSQLQSVRVRSQRTAAAAVERARLSLVPNRPSSAPRAPFAVLVFVILGLGVVGLLMFNTHMQQASFAATKLQDRADALQAKSESLQRLLDGKRDPQALAVAGRRLHMVTPQNPTTLDLETGRIMGIPLMATYGDGTRIYPRNTPVPGSLNPKPLVKKVVAPTTPTTPANAGSKTGNTSGAKAGNSAGNKAGNKAGKNGPASTGSGTGAGTNDSSTSSAPSGTGAPR